MSIFAPRVHYKPFEYPGVMRFIDAINQSFWVHSEVDFTADIQDFHSHLNAAEQSAIKHSLLAIAQIEVSVKTFWGNLYRHMPKPEMNGLGSCFAECEFRHSEAYSRLLEVLGYTDDFVHLVEVPVIQQRIEYLTDALTDASKDDPKTYLVSLILFSILIENVSLFSQFAIILSFTRFRGILKNVSNIIAWMSIDEQIHANAGIYLINEIVKESPSFLDEQAKKRVVEVVDGSLGVEEKLLHWIFENGTIQHVSVEGLLDFMRRRVDDSLKQIGMDEMYRVPDERYRGMAWFEEEVFANSLDDFFAKRPTEYTKHDKSLSADDLF